MGNLKKVSKLPSQSANSFVPSEIAHGTCTIPMKRKTGRKEAAPMGRRGKRSRDPLWTKHFFRIWFCVCDTVCIDYWKCDVFIIWRFSFYIVTFLERERVKKMYIFYGVNTSLDVLSLCSPCTWSTGMGAIHLCTTTNNNNNNKGVMELLGLGGLSPFLGLAAVVLALGAMIFGKTPETWLWQHSWATFCFYYGVALAAPDFNILREAPHETNIEEEV